MSPLFILLVAVGALVCLHMPCINLQPPLPGELVYNLALTAVR